MVRKPLGQFIAKWRHHNSSWGMCGTDRRVTVQRTKEEDGSMRCFTLHSSGIVSSLWIELRPQGAVIGMGSGEKRRYVSVERNFAKTLAKRPIPCADRCKPVSVPRGSTNPVCSHCGTPLELVQRSYRHPDRGEVKPTWSIRVERASVLETPTGPVIMAEIPEESAIRGALSQQALVFVGIEGGRWGSSSVTGLQTDRTIIHCSNRDAVLSWNDVQHGSDRQARCRMCDLPVERSPWMNKWAHPDEGYLLKWSSFPGPGVTLLSKGDYEEERPRRIARTESLITMEPGATFLAHITGETHEPDRLQVTWDGEHLYIYEGRVGTVLCSTNPTVAPTVRRPW
jgi:hypothetical protein